MRILIPLLLMSIFLIPIVSSQPEIIYFIELKYNLTDFDLNGISLTTGYPSVSAEDTGTYSIELVSNNGETLFSGMFDVPNVIMIAPPLNPGEESGIREIESLNFSISIPHSDSAERIEISNEEQVLLTMDVSYLSDYCGNDICSISEDADNCPDDCLDSFQEEPSQYPSGSDVQEKAAGEDYSFLTPLILVIAVVILAVMILAKKMR